MATRSGMLARWKSTVAALTSPPFPVPVTDCWIIKAAGAYNPGPGSASVEIDLYDATGVNKTWLVNTNLVATARVLFATWFALAPGDYIVFVSDVAGVSFQISGADLQGHL
jgi:hypothetical protein